LELPYFKPLDYRLKIDGNEENITAMMAVAANGNTYGGGMKVLPNADARDGLIDLLILNRVSKFELLRVFPKVFFGKHVTHPAVKIMRCKELEISSSAPIYADGEYFGTGPIKIEMAHNSLTIMSNR
jgi:diacylglycerol kinase (ATP)